MFDHIVDPDTRFRARKFMEARPLETFLFISFAYMLIRFFSYSSLVHAYMALIIYCYFLKYGNYYMDWVYERAFAEMTKLMKREHERIILAPFMKPPDIRDGNDLVEKEDSAEDAREEAVAEDGESEDVTEEDVTEEDVTEEDVAEGAEEEDETDAVDMQKDMDEMIQQTEKDSYLELRKRHVPRG